MVFDYKFSEKLSGDIAVTNGEGYSDTQLDNGVKAAAGITITPSNQLSFRFYNDVNNNNGVLAKHLS